MIAWRAAAAAAGVLLAASAQAVVLVDFGTEGGYDGQMNTTNTWIGGGWGTVPTTAYTLDTVTLTFTMTADWQVGGNSYGSWDGGYLRRVSPFSGLDPNSPLQLEAKITAPAGMSFFDFRVMISALDGSESNYRFIPDAWPWTTPGPFTSTMAVVSSTTNLGTPYSVNATNGGFDWNTDVINEVKFQFQNAQLAGPNPGPNTGSVAFEIDNIQAAAVPEPTVIAGLVASSLGLMIRRHRK